MIDIFCGSGTICSVKMTYEIFQEILRDDWISEDDFIQFRFEDGARGAVRKRDVIGFCESMKEK